MASAGRRSAKRGGWQPDEVEAYLRQDGIWSNFCASAATLRIDDASVFIRPPAHGAGDGFFSPKSGEHALFSIAADVKACPAGR